MSLYLSGPPEAYYKESIFIATFSAIERWIFVSCSAVNWSLPFQCIELRSVDYYKSTVGAGTIDRDFPVLVIFGNGKNYTGVLLFKGDALPAKLLPFVYAGNAILGTVNEGRSKSEKSENCFLGGPSFAHCSENCFLEYRLVILVRARVTNQRLRSSFDARD
ncbi:hypothetical protein DY000_02037703 [Brassica cretica]|uniref:Uncharacterized protein n=1 Tax=Brassica cretica TaxID=69181 RepID=A0ABQ7BIL3_BRACR|nr:hypothetical protein DY000_02037703 [Brassica cretica]